MAVGSFVTGLTSGVFQGMDWRAAREDRKRRQAIVDEEMNWRREDRGYAAEERTYTREERARRRAEEDRARGLRQAELDAWNETVDGMLSGNGGARGGTATVSTSGAPPVNSLGGNSVMPSSERLSYSPPTEGPPVSSADPVQRQPDMAEQPLTVPGAAANPSLASELTVPETPVLDRRAALPQDEAAMTPRYGDTPIPMGQGGALPEGVEPAGLGTRLSDMIFGNNFKDQETVARMLDAGEINRTEAEVIRRGSNSSVDAVMREVLRRRRSNEKAPPDGADPKTAGASERPSLGGMDAAVASAVTPSPAAPKEDWAATRAKTEAELERLSAQDGQAASPVPAPQATAPQAAPLKPQPQGLPTTPSGTPVASVAVAAATAPPAQPAKPGGKLSFGVVGKGNAVAATPAQRERAATAGVKAYTETEMPKIVEHYLRNGEVEKAAAFEKFIADKKTQEGMRSWMGAVHALNIGDSDAFIDGIVGAYNSYYDDGYTALQDQSEFVKDESGQIASAKIAFRNDKTGEVFVQEFNDTLDMLTAVIGQLSPEGAYDTLYDMTFGQKKKDDTGLTLLKEAIKIVAADPSMIGASTEEKVAAAREIAAGLAGSGAAPASAGVTEDDIED